jgi:hypothetical protein
MVGTRLSWFSWGDYGFRIPKASLACYPLKGPGGGVLAQGVGNLTHKMNFLSCGSFHSIEIPGKWK